MQAHFVYLPEQQRYLNLATVGDVVEVHRGYALVRTTLAATAPPDLVGVNEGDAWPYELEIHDDDLAILYRALRAFTVNTQDILDGGSHE